MGKLLTALTIAAAVLAGALVEWVCGRVLLPEMGLTAPGYWTWFWFTFWALLFGVGVKALAVGMKDW